MNIVNMDNTLEIRARGVAFTVCGLALLAGAILITFSKTLLPVTMGLYLAAIFTVAVGLIAIFRPKNIKLEQLR